MPRFPTYQRQVGLSGGSTASYASAGAFTAPAAALANAGDAVADLGGVIEAKQRQAANSLEDTWFSKARADTALEMQRQETEAQQSATEGATGFTEAMGGRYEETRKRYLESAPSDRARQMYDEWSHSYRTTVVGNAAQFQARSTLVKRDSDFASTMLAHSQTVLADPGQYDAVHKRAMDDLAGARQWMTPEQETKARTTVERELQLARAKAEIQRDPQAFLSEIGVGQAESGPQAYRDAIASIESAGSGDYAAIGPKHRRLGRALGRYQIMEANIGPWSQKHLGRRVSVDEFMANPAIQDAIFDGEFGSYVAKYGPEGAAQAWFAGEGGVGKTGRKDSLGTNVGEYGQRFLKALGKKATPQVSGNPRYSMLDSDDLLGLQQNAESQLNSMLAQQKAEQTAVLADIKGAFQLGIATADPGVTQHSILNSPLPDDDKAQLLNSLGEKQKDTIMARDTAIRMDEGGSFNPYSAEDRKGVSLAYDAATGGQSLFGDGNAQAVLGYMYSRSGVVPKTAMNEIRAGLLSSDPKMVAAAASVAAQLDGVNRGGLEAAENGEALQTAAAKYNHLTQTLGLTNEQAGQRMIDMADPEKQRQRAALLESKPVKDRLKSIDAAEVRNIYDPGMFGFDPDLGESPLAESAMVADYRAMFEESLVEADGDEELAETLASDRFQRLYGPSPLTLAGDGVITRLPPEKTYPAGPDGTHGYIREQAIEALTAEGVEAEDVFLAYYDETEQDYRAGQPARYQVWYKQNGELQLYSLPFYAVAPKGGGADFSSNRAARDENRQRLLDGRDREKTLDNYLDGPTMLPTLVVPVGE